eukprot:CAMPEP_0113940380 /NCGR_PEP_ID=MMETSP1339-20121228/6514_1 /TAXON_ID=94617 /ORGANISM="Fibrocapsa japonica" /LENGTH=196 /DNA_ID=CAMNT_0000944183 /DNA_START=74 /DNA_END=661 /DNA_ORIENTATION=+ /assembly_acc=CAM_ASM_000762
MAIVGSQMMSFIDDRRLTSAVTPKLDATSNTRAIRSALFSKRFLHIWLIVASSAVSGMNLAGLYKVYGSQCPKLASEAFLCHVGATAALANGSLRMGWGIAMDKLGPKKPWLALAAAQALIYAAYPMATASPAAYLALTCLGFACLGGNFVVSTQFMSQSFGEIGSKLYPFMFTAFGVSSVLGSMLIKRAVPVVGW